MKFIRKSILLFCTLFFTGGLLYAQEEFSKTMWLEDFNTYVKWLQETHPDPYTPYGGRSYFMKAVQEARASITEEMTMEEFTELLTGLIIPLEDAHTWINQSFASANNSIPDKYMPVFFQIATDGLFVAETRDAFSSYTGYKLLAVEGQPVDSLLPKARKLRPVENKYGAFIELRYRLWSQKAATSLFGKKDGLLFRFLTPQGNIEETELPFEETRDRTKRTSALPLSEDNGLLYGQMLDDNTGYLRWNSMTAREFFGTMDRRNAYSHPAMNSIYQYYLKQEKPEDAEEAYMGIPSIYETFTELLTTMKSRNATYLIVDLQRNGGGMTPLCLPMLYMLYGDKYLEYHDVGEYNRIVSPLLLKKWGLDSIDRYNETYNVAYQWGDFMFGSVFYNTDEPLEEKRRKTSMITYQGVGEEYTSNLNGVPVYEPHVIVLCSPATFSAAYHFMYFLAKIGKATVVGVPASQAGNTFMEVTEFQLPHTKITGSFSNALQIMFPHDPEMGKVYKPDFPMTWSDYARYGFDPNAEILYVLDLIKDKQILHD